MEDENLKKSQLNKKKNNTDPDDDGTRPARELFDMIEYPPEDDEDEEEER